MFLAVAREGIIVIRVQDYPLTAQETKFVRAAFAGNLRVTNQRLIIIDGMQFFDEDNVEEGNIGEEDTLPLPNGSYRFQVHQLNRQPSHGQIGGFFGYTQWPTAVIELQPVSEDVETLEAGASRIACFDTSDWPTKAIPGIQSLATVKQVRDGMAILDLHTTQSVRSGTARIAINRDEKLKRTQQVLVRLEEDQGDHWHAGLIQTLEGP